MFSSLYQDTESNPNSEDEGYREYDELSAGSDQEEIEQALYAQIHYCQNEEFEDEKDLKFEYTESGKFRYNKIILENKNFLVKSQKHDHNSVTDTDTLPTKIKHEKKKTKSKSFQKKKDEFIVINSQTSDSEVIVVNCQTSDSEVIVVNSQPSDSESIQVSSESDFDLDSDCMILDESCDDMGDIVLNVENKNVLDNLTVRNIKDKDEADKWSIIAQDRFMGNPLLGRYYKKSSVRCHNCNEIGHLSKVCPQPRKVITCYLCGESGHCGKNCTNPICYNCNKPGHINVDCTGPRRSRYTDCHRCQMLGHTAYECPEIWRQFHLTTGHGGLVRGQGHENSRRHCPNCAGDDHFDYECVEDRMDRHSLPIYPFIAQYRKSDVRVNKRQRERQDEDLCNIPTKRRKLDDDFIRSPSFNMDSDKSNKNKNKNDKYDRNTYEMNNHSELTKKKKKNKQKEQKKKEENFRKMMDNDFYTFEKNTKKPIKNRNSNNNKKKKKEGKKKGKGNQQKNNDRSTSVQKKKKKKSKKIKKEDKSTKHKQYSASNSSRGFNVKHKKFEITFHNR